jgi:ATP-dependent 26S proteasome regulatory subunit
VCCLQGVILYGEPGTGKTLLAKAVANSTSATFLRVVGSELIQKYLGDGPKLVRELFRVADEMSPSIVFIGECCSHGQDRQTDRKQTDRTDAAIDRYKCVTEVCDRRRASAGHKHTCYRLGAVMIA